MRDGQISDRPPKVWAVNQENYAFMIREHKPERHFCIRFGLLIAIEWLV
jgi:hypothetical protein